MASKFSVEAVFKAVDKITAPISRIQNRVGQMTRSMERGFKRLNRTMQKFERGLKSVSRAAVGAATTMGIGLVAVAKTGADFQQQLVNAAVKLGPNVRRGTKEFKELENATRNVGKTTQFTATQAAEAAETLAKSGLNLKQTITALAGSVNFAIASQRDMTEATQISLRTLGAFGLKTKDSTQNTKNLARVYDVLTLAQNKANLSIDDMFESISNAGPAAEKLGMSLEETSAVFDTLANNATVGSKAGTSLKTMLIAITKPSKEAKSIFNKLNVTLVDSHKRLKDLLTIMDDIRNSKLFKAQGPAEQQALILTIFGRRGFIGADALIGLTDATRDLQKQLEKAGGTAKRFAEVMRNTFKGKVLILMSAVQEQMIKTFEKLDPQLEKTTKKLTKLVNSKQFAGWITNIGNAFLFILNNLPEILTWIKRIIEAFLIFKVVTTVMSTFLLVMETLNAIMDLNPFFLLILVIGLLILAVIEISKHWRALFKLFDKLPAPLAETLKELTVPFIILGKVIVFVAKRIGQAFMDMFSLLKFIFTAITDPFEAMSEVFTGMPKIIKESWQDLSEFFKSLWNGIVDGFKSVIKEIEDLTGFSTIMSFIHSAEGIFGFGKDKDKDQDAAPAAAAQVVSPHDRTAKTIQETRKTSTAEVTIKDDTGRAEVTKGKMGSGLALQTTGNF